MWWSFNGDEFDLALNTFIELNIAMMEGVFRWLITEELASELTRVF